MVVSVMLKKRSSETIGNRIDKSFTVSISTFIGDFRKFENREQERDKPGRDPECDPKKFVCDEKKNDENEL